MTVFLAHSFADLDAAEAIAKSIERRGLFVEHEDGERVGRALQSNDAVVLLWSSLAGGDPNHLLLERRAFDAWADDKLILISLDRSVRPVGLRDLPAIDASEPERWPAAWEEANAAIAVALTVQGGAPALTPAPAKSTANSNSSLRGLGGLFLLIGLLGLIALAVFLYQRVQYAVFDLPQIPDWALWAGLAAVVALFWLARMLMRPSKSKPKRARRKVNSAKRAAKRAEEDAQQSDAVFVAYAPDDAVAVGPVVAAVEAFGRRVWIDKAGVSGEIVRSIRTARGVIIMCSPAAFQSDHVKREVYLADRYRKPMLPVFIKATTLPPDFEYFFAGVQGLDLVATPEPERPEALRVALAAV